MKTINGIWQNIRLTSLMHFTVLRSYVLETRAQRNAQYKSERLAEDNDYLNYEYVKFSRRIRRGNSVSINF